MIQNRATWSSLGLFTENMSPSVEEEEPGISKKDVKHWQQPDPPVDSRRELASCTTLATVFEDMVRSRFVDAVAT